MTDWAPDGTAVPLVRPVSLSEEQRDEVRRNLHSVGIFEDPFATPRLPRFAKESEFGARALYAAVLHVTKGSHQLTMSFSEWSRSVGLPW